MSQPNPRTPDLLNIVRREITLQAIGSVAAELGEDTDRTASAVSVGVPSVLTLLSEVASSPNGAAHLEAAIVAKSPEVDAREPVLLDGRAGQRAATFLDRELGSRAWDASDEMSRASGIKRESAHTLLGGVASVTLLALARNLGSMSSGALRSLLIDQRDDWRSGEATERMRPSYAGNVPASDVPTERVYGAPATTTDRVYEAHAIRPQERRSRRWLLPVLLLLAAIVAIPVILGLGRRYQHRVVAPVTSEETTPRASAPQARAAAPEATAPATGNEGQPAAAAPAASDLGAFLGSSEGPLPRRFPLPLTFDTGATLPTSAATASLDDVAAALRAHPSAQIRIESTADDGASTSETDKALAQSRAEAVKGQLVGRGIDGDRITAAVASTEPPAAEPNANPSANEGSTNARVDLIVTGR